jgi:glycosyltransferase involved in cell wall biosynthesis
LLPYFARRFAPRLVKQVVAQADVIFTVSSHSRGDIIDAAARHGLRRPAIVVLPLGTGFQTWGPRAESESPKASERLPSRFVLYVSTIEQRKNHRLLVQVWQRLVARHGAAAMPDLVFVGRPGYVIIDFLNFRSELMASGCVGGKVHILSDLSDTELAEAYRRCLFTVYPSSYEGWGLPVAESLAHGKFCVSSDRTSLPEVGGSFVDYFDPDDIEDVVLKIERPLFDPAYLAAREARLRAEYRPASWADCAHALIAALDRATWSPRIAPSSATRSFPPAVSLNDRGVELREPR